MSRLYSEGGFTLIETIIVLIVLSIAAVGVLSVFISGMRGSADPLLVTQAVQLAQGEMDQIIGSKRAAGFGSIAIGNSLPCATAMPSGFTCSRNIYYVNAADLTTSVPVPTEYKHVTVTVSNAAIGDVSMDTLVSNY